MRKINILLFAAAVGMSAIMAVSCNGGPAEVSLYNGQNLDGWVAVTDGGGITPFEAKGDVISISGQPFGYLRTEKVYGDYKAHMEFCWSSDPGTNSGFFQRVQPGDQVWPAAVECQLCAGKLGDFVGLGGARLDGKESESRFPVKARSGEDSEKSTGEWNSIDVEVIGTHIKYFVNGVLQNEVDCDFTSGYVAVQSEGGPLCVRNITITEL